MAESETDPRSVGTVVVLSVVWVLTMFLSITGNSLVCLALYRNTTLRTITNMYVLALAISDLTLATLALPFEIAASVLRYWPFGFNFCQFNGLLAHSWCGVSTFTLASTAINRYFCVLKPQLYRALFTKRNTIVSIIFIVILTFIAGLAVTLLTPVIYRWNFYGMYCRQTFLDAVSEEITFYVFVVVYSVLPTSVVIFCYSNVYLAVRRHNAAISPPLQQEQTHVQTVVIVNAQEIRSSRILFVAVVVFIIFWIPGTVTLGVEMISHRPSHPIPLT